jgi:hypothetical protein
MIVTDASIFHCLAIALCFLPKQAEKATAVDPITTEPIDSCILYDAPLREKIYALIDAYKETGVIPGAAGAGDENKDGNGGDGSVTIGAHNALSGPGNAASGKQYDLIVMYGLLV